MCFSSNASFGAGIILSTIGILSIKLAKLPNQIMFACIPLVFAIQQLTEGFLWVALLNPKYASLEIVSTYNFLFFAQVVWPFLVPFSIYKLEKEIRRKKILFGLSVIGLVVSMYLAYCLLNYQVVANIIGNHMSYKQDYPKDISKYCALLYIIATIVPPFFSSIKWMWLLGLTIFISYIMTTIFYVDYIVSVWCFFASIISMAVWLIVYLEDRSKNLLIPNEHVDLA